MRHRRRIIDLLARRAVRDVGANRRHERRLQSEVALRHQFGFDAEWLDGATLHLTQEYLASLLGSQRTTVNEAAQGLQKAGAITYSRGRVTILDRAALERAACECYRHGQRSSLDIPEPQ